MTQGEGTAVDQFRNHWQTQPRVARFAWCVGFAGHSALQQLVTAYQRALQDLNCLDLVPMDALQLTLLEIGTAEDVTDAQLAEIVAAGRRRLAALDAPELTFGTAELIPDGVVLAAAPAAGVAAIREALRGALSDAGVASGDSAPGPARVALAYANEETTAAFAKATLTFVDATPAAVTVDRVDLVRFDGRYRSADWSTHDRVSLA